jgi:hypothetical protein
MLGYHPAVKKASERKIFEKQAPLLMKRKGVCDECQ